jgi:hypothetical protein
MRISFHGKHRHHEADTVLDACAAQCQAAFRMDTRGEIICGVWKHTPPHPSPVRDAMTTTEYYLIHQQILGRRLRGYGIMEHGHLAVPTRKGLYAALLSTTPSPSRLEIPRSRTWADSLSTAWHDKSGPCRADKGKHLSTARCCRHQVELWSEHVTASTDALYEGAPAAVEWSSRRRPNRPPGCPSAGYGFIPRQTRIDTRLDVFRFLDLDTKPPMASGACRIQLGRAGVLAVHEICMLGKMHKGWLTCRGGHASSPNDARTGIWAQGHELNPHCCQLVLAEIGY